MIAREIKRLAEAHTPSELEAAADAIAEGEELPFDVVGEDEGEKVTNLLLASRIAAKVAAGEAPKTAFRSVMGDVRDLLKNES